MIKETRVWVREVQKDLERLKALAADASGSEALLEIENLMVRIGFSLRKLEDSRKLPDNLLSGTILLAKKYHRNKDIQERSNPEEDFRAGYHPVPVPVEIRLRDFLNWMIHSFIFLFGAKENSIGVNSILVNSDRSRKDGMFLISLPDLLTSIETEVMPNIQP